ncbi:N-acetylmuramoyl-L-alanine amidase [Pontibacter sp. BT731]|uniref:N-acetylmuramoyl-L-alanine amidase n=1 Tax=Pontibacter coccineus TaxID=3063328 RepID=UPI0026E44930|nr:N-acetylmuramoyl-L-alanine amidase [Pontibacter sp. BT731]MDO6388985.1 N-acetylmuramoyl-L-alanine amidase [Pontibacter sp. BT731]
MRKIDNLVIHCTATVQTAKVESIQRYWRDTLKWRSSGYHVIIEANGNIVRLAEDSAVCNGVAGHNSNSLHVSYIGGIDAKGKGLDNRTPQQKVALWQVIKAWKQKYPNAKVLGHRDFPSVKKECPSFDAGKWWESLQN